MTVNEASFLYLFLVDIFVSSRKRTTAHWVLTLVSHVKSLPKTVQVFDIVMVVLVWRAASKRIQGFTSHPSFYPLVISKDLCPDFLKYQNPDLVLMAVAIWGVRLREGPRLWLLIVGEVVINDNCAFLAINIHGYCITTGYIDLLSEEDLFDTVWVLSNGTYGSQEVTVTTAPL